MNDAILIQQMYPETEGLKMLDLVKERHAQYCKAWHMDYKSVVDYVFDHNPDLGGWAKVELIRQAMKDGYQYIIWLDADTIIYDMEEDLRSAVVPFSIGACWHRIPQLHHWNIGALYIDNTEETSHFISRWLAAYPPKHDGWHEQGVFNEMGRASKLVVTLSDKWNATLDVNMVPDAVVLGFHGQGDVNYRYEVMKQTLDKIATKEAVTTPADGVR